MRRRQNKERWREKIRKKSDRRKECRERGLENDMYKETRENKGMNEAKLKVRELGQQKLGR